MNHIIEFGTELSKTGNYFLGDKTERTITKTIMDGTDNKISGLVVHIVLGGSIIALTSNNKNIRMLGVVGLGFLGVAYLAGRNK